MKKSISITRYILTGSILTLLVFFGYTMSCKRVIPIFEEEPPLSSSSSISTSTTITPSSSTESQAPTTAPAPPANVSVEDGVSTEELVVTWDQSELATGYNIYKGKSENGEFTLVAQANTKASTTYKDTNVLPNKTYFYRIVATNDIGESEMSAAESGYITSETAPPEISPDGYEENDDMATVTLINDATPQTHTVAPGGDEDWFLFSATAGSTYKIQTKSVALGTSVDTKVYVYNNAGDLQVFNDDSDSADIYSLINNWSCTVTGQYYIKVIGFSDTETGDYEITVTETASANIGDDFETDNNITDAATLEAGTPQTHSIHSPTDIDFVTFSGQEGAVYVIQTYSAGAGDDVDTLIYLYDASESEITNDDDSASGGFSRIFNWICPSTDTYYVKIISKNDGIGNYALALSEDTGDSFEPDNTSTSASNVTFGVAQDRTIHSVQDVDWIQFTATSGNRYTIETQSGGAGDDVDTKIKFYDTDGTSLLDEDDDSGSGKLSLIDNWTCITAGTYYVKVEAVLQDTGDYDLLITEYVGDEYETDNASGSASTLMVASEQMHSIHEAADEDWMSFNATSGTEYTIITYTEGSGDDVDTYLYLYDTGVSVILEDDNSGTGNFSKITAWTCTGDGTYYLKVVSTGTDTTGFYKIRIESNGGDSYETDNAFGDANPISFGVEQGHTIHVGTDEDWLSFTGTLGKAYTVETKSAGFGSDVDTVVEIHGPTPLDLKTSDDNNGTGDYSKITAWSPSATDTYYIRVFSNASGTGDYTLTLTEDAGDTYEEDNTDADASTFNLGTFQKHSIHHAGDIDWVKFSATADTSYKIETYEVTADKVDTKFEVYASPVGGVLDQDDNSGLDNFAVLNAWCCPSDGDYFVKVFSMAGDTMGDYNIRITDLSSNGDSYESDDTAGTATEFITETTQTHSIHICGDEDWFYFTGYQGNTYTLETLTAGGTDADTVLNLYSDTSGTLVTSDDNSGTGDFSKVTDWACGTSQTYYVKIVSTGTVTVGDYNLKITEKGWHNYMLDSLADVGRYSSIALDGSDHPHIAYFDAINWNLKYMHWDGSSWTTEIIDSEGGRGEFASIDVDSSNHPHISYSDNSLAHLRHAGYDGSSWTTEDADSTFLVGAYTSISVDSADHLHISYNATSDLDLLYSYYNGTSWSRTVVESSNEVGKYSSIAVDSSDQPHISYEDQTNRNLKYAKYNGSSWSTEVVDDSGTVGTYTAIAVDGTDTVHIAYYDSGNKDLKYAKWNGSAWDKEIVDSTGEVGSYASLALDSSNYPHIAYYDADNQNLKYAYFDGSIWQIEARDVSADDRGKFTSIAIDSSDYPHITYYDDTNNELRYTYKNN